MDCTNVRGFIQASIDSELDSRKQASLDAHLAQCQACAAYQKVFKGMKVRLSMLDGKKHTQAVKQIVERSIAGDEEGGEGEFLAVAGGHAALTRVERA
jgi:anti-sigma factor RsiW